MNPDPARPSTMLARRTGRPRLQRPAALLVALAAVWLLNSATPTGRPAARLSGVQSSATLDQGITGLDGNFGNDFGDFNDAVLEPYRAAWFAASRVYPNEVFPAGALIRAREQAVALETLTPYERTPFERLVPRRGPFQLYRPIDHSVLGPWVSYGPAPLCETSDCTGGGQPYNGRVTAIATNPLAPDTMYVGSPGGGVWRTRNGGGAWTPLFDEMPSMAVGALALDPQQPSRIFAGTGNDGAYAGYMGVGLFRSKDEGNHWSKVGGSQFDGCAFTALHIYPTDDALMVASVSVDPTYGAPAAPCVGGVFLSTDRGTTWTRWLDRSQVDDVTFGPARLLPVGFQGGQALDALSIQVFAGVHDEGLYGSSVMVTPGGGISSGSWQQIGGGLPTSGMSAVRIAVAPSNPSRAYVIMGNPEPGPGTFLGAWTTANGGQVWTPFDPPPGNWYTLSLAVDPLDSNRLYVGSGYIYRVDGAGATIVPLSTNGGAHSDVRSLVFDGLHRLYAGTDGGIVRTSDDQTFESVNGNLSIAQVNPGISGSLQGNGALVPGGPFLAGLLDNGTVQYSGTQVWHEVFTGDGGYSAVNPAHPDTEYVTFQLLGLYKATDGANFTYAGDTRWDTEPRAFFAPLVMDLVRPDRLYAGTQKVYRSVNAAGSWQIISPDFHSDVTAIAPAASDAQVVYAGTREAGIEVTADGGGSWTKGTGLPDRAVNDFAVDPANAADAWAALGGFGAGHLFQTTDQGYTWTDASGDLPDAPVNAVAVDSRYSPPVLFVGTDVGVFLSLDGGTRWLASRSGLPNAPVTDLLLKTDEGQLVAGTYGRGLWAAPEHVLPSISRPPLGPPHPIFDGGVFK